MNKYTEILKNGLKTLKMKIPEYSPAKKITIFSRILGILKNDQQTNQNIKQKKDHSHDDY